MKEEITSLKNKMVNPEGFFKDVIKEIRKTTKIENIDFLALDEKTGGFITKYSTNGSKVCITRTELKLLCLNNKEGIIFPETEFNHSDQSIIRWTLFTKTRWKVWFYKICAIMPIYFDDKIICLVLFRDQPNNRWTDRNISHLKKIKVSTEYCLGSIFLYNQALGRVIREFEG